MSAVPRTVDATIAGTLSSPRITGRVHVQDTSLRYGDFPAGLSQLAGDFIFDTSRITFNNVTSETGGGRLLLSGSLTYGNGPASTISRCAPNRCACVIRWA